MTAESTGDQSLVEFLAAYEPPPEDYEAHQQLLQHIADSELQAATSVTGVLADLREHGFDVNTFDDLNQPGVGNGSAVHVLLHHLAGVTDVSLIIDLTKPLRAIWARDTAVTAVAELYPTLTDKNDPTGQVRFYLGDTLERIANDSIADRMLNIARTGTGDNRGRGMVVMGLARLTKSRDQVVPVLLDLLNGSEVDVYAAIALGKLKVAEARPGIERLTEDGDPWVRQKETQALAKLPND